MLFWGIFWFGLKIVAFETEQESGAEQGNAGTSQSKLRAVKPNRPATKLLSIGFLFLFDRLVPGFEIREENYSIGRMYGRVSPLFGFKGKKVAVSSSYEVRDLEYWPLRLLGRKVIIAPLGKKEKAQFNNWVIGVRIMGAIYSIFLLTALNALVKH